MNTAKFELRTVLPPANGEAAVPVAQVHGDVDVTNAADLHTALTGFLPGGLIVDLSQAGYFDSAGFAVLDRLLSQKCMAVVAAPGSVVRTAMTLLNLTFHDTIDSARASLQTR